MTDISKQTAQLADAWSNTSATAPYFSGNYDDYAAKAAASEDATFLVAHDTTAGRPLFLPFFQSRHIHKFTIGERRIGGLSLNAPRLAHIWLPMSHSAGDIAQALPAAFRDGQHDALVLGELPEDSSLRDALRLLKWPLRGMRLGRKTGLRWLIELPETFDAYLAGLSKSTRQSTRRKMRKLRKDFQVDIQVITAEDDLDRFLEEGEKISRLTYQWHVGQRLLNDTVTRAGYAKLCAQGRLRCYLLSIDGSPTAFLRGTIEGNTYHYETPGFDPAFGKWSIGTVILMDALEDLIANTKCTMFDFGTGGDDTSYKSTYGTHSIPCSSYYVLRLTSLRGLTVLIGESVLTAFKNTANAVLPKGERRDRIKRWLRRSGASD